MKQAFIRPLFHMMQLRVTIWLWDGRTYPFWFRFQQLEPYRRLQGSIGQPDQPFIDFEAG